MIFFFLFIFNLKIWFNFFVCVVVVFRFVLLWSLQVSVFAENHFLDALCLQHLLSQVAGDNFSLFFRDYTDQILHGEPVCFMPC